MKNAINGSNAQDAFWYAQCVGANGAGEVFSAGQGRTQRGTGEAMTLLDAFRLAVREARAAGVDLSGLDLVKGKLATRGKALRVRIWEQCANVGIIASAGERIANMTHPGQTAAQVAKEYGMTVPAEIIQEEQAELDRRAEKASADLEADEMVRSFADMIKASGVDVSRANALLVASVRARAVRRGDLNPPIRVEAHEVGFRWVS